MDKTELLELIENGENSGVELKRDEVHPHSLAKEVAALLNVEGGHIMLGVEDDGSVTGLGRGTKETEEWVMNLCRENVQPGIIPYWETVSFESSKVVGIVTLPADSPDKPYKARRGSAWVTFVRVGSTSREATREEEARLYQSSRMMRYDIKPVTGAEAGDLDTRRVRNYFRDVLGQECPDPDNRGAWTQVLLNTDIFVSDRSRVIPTVSGLLLFGMSPNRHLPQAGITATAYPAGEKAYETVDEEIIRGPLVSLLSEEGDVLDRGVIDRACDFVNRNTGSKAWLEDGRRVTKKVLPEEAVREAIVNAVAHRDYTIGVTDVEISLYEDRLEVVSPGRLPNTVTVEKMKQGYRAARNELLKEILRDYGYVEYRGMGVRYRIIDAMRRHNGTEPDLIEEDDRFTVRLWKDAKAQ